VGFKRTVKEGRRCRGKALSVGLLAKQRRKTRRHEQEERDREKPDDDSRDKVKHIEGTISYS